MTRAEHLSPWGAIEDGYRGRRPIEAGNRLGCAATILGDVVIDVPAASQLHRPVIRKSIEVSDLTVDPLVRLYYLELGPPPGHGDGDGTVLAARVLSAVEREWALTGATMAPHLLGDLAPAIEADGGRLTVAVRAGATADEGPGGGTIVGVWPGLVDRVVGAAIDVGSTTVAATLVDLASGEILAEGGRMNPQIRFGEDLMSRVSYAMMNPDGAATMTASIHQALDELIGELLAAAGDLDRRRLLDVVVVGNPVMHHLVLGLDPTPLGQAPFPLATDLPVDGPATMVGIEAPWARAHVGPCVSGHVGADTAAAVLSEGPHRGDGVQLLVDVGTNAEIVLGNRHRLLVASSPTGPAFEGAQITAGQRATPGAIERVRIDRRTLEPRFKVIGIEPWSDEAGFEAGTAHTPITGICGSGIVEAISELFLSQAITSDGVILGPDQAASRSGADPSPRVVADGRTHAYVLTDTVHLTQADVRAIQLAKAALRAGIELLIDEAGELGPIDEIRLAGAFGAHLDPIHAMVLGLIPDGPIDRVTSVGNAAGSGAVRALVSARQRREMAQVVTTMTRIETATEPRFQEHFVAAIPFPHARAENPNLAALVELPRPRAGGRPARGRRRRPNRPDQPANPSGGSERP
jgi:uncharacterized 2Fe-2S/4Fe-4S cluster protein (DUF4445 family)